MIYLVAISLFIYISYNIYVIRRFGIPKSLSQTSYLLLNYNKKFYFFSFLCISVGVLLWPVWCELSPKEISILPALALSGFILSGLTPLFHRSLEKPIHYISSVLTFVFFSIWILMVNMVLFVADAVMIGMFFVLHRECYVYHAENIIAFTLMFYLLYILI